MRDALERIGGFEEPPVEQIVPAVEPLRYRNKVEYSFGNDEDGELVLGFHRPGRWDLIDGVSEDILASERVDELRDAVGPGAARRASRPTTAATTPGCCATSWCARAGAPASCRRASSRAPATSAAELAAALPVESVLWTRAAGVAETTRDGETEVLKGEQRLEEELAGLRFRISPDAFFQTNTEMAERLYAIASELAGLSGRERVFDLYCGIGTIALALALDAGEVWGVEIVERAVADAIENARAQRDGQRPLLRRRRAHAMRPLLEESGPAGRRGGRPAARGPVAEGRAPRARGRGAEDRLRVVQPHDAGAERAPDRRRRLRARAVRPVDMFPQTPHIECVALLERLDSPAAWGTMRPSPGGPDAFASGAARRHCWGRP